MWRTGIVLVMVMVVWLSRIEKTGGLTTHPPQGMHGQQDHNSTETEHSDHEQTQTDHGDHGQTQTDHSDHGQTQTDHSDQGQTQTDQTHTNHSDHGQTQTDHSDQGQTQTDHSDHGQTQTDHSDHEQTQTDHVDTQTPHGNQVNGDDHSSHGKAMQEVGSHAGHGLRSGHALVFHAGVNSYILFSGWVTRDWQGLLASCVGLAIIAALYEGLKVGRELLHAHRKRRPGTDSPPTAVVVVNGSASQPHTNDHVVTFTKSSWKSRILNKDHFIQTVLHIIQVWIGFSLMLVFMTFNIWLCLAVTMGAGLGYFLFAWARADAADTEDHCN